MIKHAFVLPGIFGSDLCIRLAPNSPHLVQIWPPYHSLLGFTPPDDFMRLNPDGTSGPGVGPTSPLFPKACGINQDYYGGLISSLNKLPLFGVWPMPYDWRLDPQLVANQLISRVYSLAGDDDFCLIGHSNGATIAQFLYRRFVIDGKQDQCKRVITGSGCWRGSYQAVASLAGFDRWFSTALLVGGLAHSVWLSIFGVPSELALASNITGKYILTERAKRFVAGWDGIINCLPDPHQTSPRGTWPNPMYYDVDNWKDANTYITQAQLDSAKANYDLENDLRWAFPQDKVYHMVGAGVDTFEGRIPDCKLSFLSSLAFPLGGTAITKCFQSSKPQGTANQYPGDGVLLVSQQFAPFTGGPQPIEPCLARKKVMFPIKHAEIAMQPGFWEYVKQVITEERAGECEEQRPRLTDEEIARLRASAYPTDIPVQSTTAVVQPSSPPKSVAPKFCPAREERIEFLRSMQLG